jgi:hypothetical protein
VRIVIGLCLLALTACGDGLSEDARAVRDMCASNAGEAAYCTCIAETLEKEMPLEAFKGMAQGGEEAELGALLDQIAKADSSCGGQLKTGN